MGVTQALGCISRLGWYLTMALPSLRDELSVFPGPASRTGSPTWSLYDPVRNLYFRIDWTTFEILCRWGMSSPEEICNSVNADTTLTLEPDAVESVVEFTVRHDLIKRSAADDTKRLDQERQRRKQSWFKQILHTYLFFRVPLLKPDQWIGKSLPVVKWLGGRFFARITLLVLFLGIFLVSRQWDSFTTSLVDMFSLKGLVAYAITLLTIKFLHELGHAYTAKNFGCRVPVMGVAFLVLFPMAYTDVNDVWRLSNKSERLKVGAAGILTELTIAAWATLLWTLVPDGPLRTGLFLLATTTWISTLAINASPFLRFDGYFLLMDALEMPNLHSRAFALARWKLRETLFGLGDPQPELLSSGLTRFLQIFAVGVWIYRLIVFGGIAILVYMMFPKPLGPLLGFIEVYWFILKPVFGEFTVWMQRREEIMRSRRTAITLGLILMLVAVFILPWDRRVDSQAILTSQESRPILVTEPARVSSVLVINGQSVDAGQLLLKMESPYLEFRLRASEEKARGLKITLALAEMDYQARSQLAVLRSQLEKVEAEIAGIKDQLDKLEIRALISGQVSWFDLDFKSGDWIRKGTELGVVRATQNAQIIGFVGQDSLKRVSVGDTALFVDEVDRLKPLKLVVRQIDTDATRLLSEPLLASTHGGEILVRSASEQLIPENAIYRVLLESADPVNLDKLPELRGHLVIQGKAEAWSAAYYRSFVAIIQREAGF